MVARTTVQSLQASEDILESMFNEATGRTPVKAPVKPTAQIIREARLPVPNVKDVEVPDAFLASIVEFANLANKSDVEEDAEEEVTQVEEIDEQAVVENKVQDLVTRLATLIKEARGVIEEMTTAGMIGVGKATGFKKPAPKAKNGLAKTVKRN